MLNILSLFDGVSTGYLALQRAGIPIKNYYSSEIDKYAIKISSKHFPDIHRLGSVVNYENWNIDWASIDLLIGGSPCQGFSFAGKQLNFNDSRSKLFFEYVDILNKIKSVNPNVKFLLENVKMKKEFQKVITGYLGVEPIEINSSLVSAQRRRRLYWTNIEGVEQPEDKGILLKDIVLENSSFDYACKQNWENWFLANIEKLLGKQYVAVSPEKSTCLLARNYASWQGTFWFEKLKDYVVPFDQTKALFEKEVEKGKIDSFQDNQKKTIYVVHGENIELGEITNDCLFGCITPDRLNKFQNGGRFNDGKKFYTLTTGDMHGILTRGYIRKLTPVEWERLQTLPDNFTSGVVDAQRYKMLGNGWTCDVISHIFSYL